MTGGILADVAISCAAFMAGVYGRRAAGDRPKTAKEK